jgi:delta 1-pyrroline-5-carboxylate dehydrogenase
MIDIKKYFNILALCSTISLFLACGHYAQENLVKLQMEKVSKSKAKDHIEMVLGGQIKDVIKYSEKQSPKDNPKVILVIERDNKKSKEVIESIFDREGRLVSIKNIDAPEGKAMSQHIVIAKDAVECRDYCLERCNYNPICYGFCWWVCITM